MESEPCRVFLAGKYTLRFNEKSLSQARTSKPFKDKRHILNRDFMTEEATETPKEEVQQVTEQPQETQPQEQETQAPEQETQQIEAPKEDDQEVQDSETPEDEISEEEEQKLPFPNATIVRLMKNVMDGDKMIKKEVKIAMNKWLGNLCRNVSLEMNKFPYVMMHLHEFRKATETYSNLENFYKEKERILAHMEAIKKDIERLERDLGKEEEDVL